MRVDVAEVAFRLRMHQGVAIDLGRRSLKNLGIVPPREFEQVQRTKHACLERMDRISLVMRRGGRAGEVVDFIDLKIRRQCVDNVVLDARKSRIAQDGIEIVPFAGVEIVQHDNVVSIQQKTLAQMRTQKSCPAGNQGAAPIDVGAPSAVPGLEFQNVDSPTHIPPLRPYALRTLPPGHSVARPRPCGRRKPSASAESPLLMSVDCFLSSLGDAMRLLVAVQHSITPEIAVTRLVPQSPIARPNCISQRVKNIPVEIIVN